jgi:carbonic anhydrase
VQDVRTKYAEHVDGAAEGAGREDRLCELNVLEQASHVCQTTIVQDAWARGQQLSVHGWIYSLEDGLLRDLRYCVTEPGGVPSALDESIAYCTGNARVPAT